MSGPVVPLSALIRPAKTIRAGGADLPVLSMTMRGGLIDQTSKFKKRIASEDVSNYKVVRRSQLVVGFPIDEGVLSFQRLYPEAIVSPAYDVWDVCLGKVFPDYLERFLRSPVALSFYAQKLRGSTARRRTLPDDVFLSLDVPLPTVAEQRRIVDILERADTLRTQRRETLAQVDRLAQAIFLEMFGDPVTGPIDCTPRTVADCVSKLEYGPRFYKEAYSSDGIRIVRITDLDQSGALDFDSMPRMDVDELTKKHHTLQAGDIVFARTGATVGKVALIQESDPPSIAGAYFIRLRFDESLVPLYAFSVLRTKSVQALIEKKSRQAAQQNFSGPGLRALPMPVPRMSVQKAFEEKVGKLRIEHQRLASSLSLMDSLSASLQYRAFSGEL